jgi:pimeloyl-ACP methyl ester carboxylesterase
VTAFATSGRARLAYEPAGAPEGADVVVACSMGGQTAADLALAHPGRGADPGARLTWLDGVAHVPHLEGDPATLEAIEQFVASLD